MTRDDLARCVLEGSLPEILVGADHRLYSGPDPLTGDWDGWLRMWWGITYVRQQALEREEEALLASEMFG